MLENRTITSVTLLQHREFDSVDVNDVTKKVYYVNDIVGLVYQKSEASISFIGLFGLDKYQELTCRESNSTI